MPIKYYRLEEVIIPEPKEGEFVIRTAALLQCGTCGKIIDGMGGPGDGAICIECAMVIKSGNARTAIVWDE